MNRKTQNDLLILIGLYLLSREDEDRPSLFQRANTALNDAGSRLYEFLHPREVNHANDLPVNPTKKKIADRLPPEVILTIAQIAGFPDPKLAAAIAMGESRGRTCVVNSNSKEYSVGLWQINTKVHPYTPADMCDPMKNAMAAYQISKGGTDWRPWTVYTKNRYQEHMKGPLA